MSELETDVPGSAPVTKVPLEDFGGEWASTLTSGGFTSRMLTQHDTTEEAFTDRPAPLWRNRDFALFWTGQLASSIGSQVSQLALPLLVLAVTHSPAKTGLMAALRGLPFALFCLPAGALTDRWDRKRTMILCDTGRALALAAVPIAYALGHLTFVLLGVVSLLEGALFVFFNQAEAGALTRLVPKSQVPAAVAANSSIESGAQLAGPALGGLLFGLGMAVPFVVDAVSYAASVIGLLCVRTEFQEERQAPARPLHHEIAEGIGWLWRQPVMRFLAISTGGLILLGAGYPLILILLAKRLHLSPFGIGLIFASGGVGSVLGGIVAHWLMQRVAVGRIMVWATWIWVLTWIPYAFAPNAVILGLVNVLGFLIVPVYLVTQYSYRLAIIPDALLGRVNSVFRLIAFGSGPLGLALAGFLLQDFGPIKTIWIIVAPQILFCAAATCYRPLRKATFPSAAAIFAE